MRHPQEPTTPDKPLVVRLRELKDGTGLSLAALAARTPYSKSAWHRYLTGTKRPPWAAVEALSRLAGADPAAVRAVWEAAEEPPAPSPPEKAGRSRSRWLPLSALALLGTAAAVAATVTVSGRQGSPAPTAQTFLTVPRCHARSCQGQLPDASVCARDAQTKSTVTDTDYDVRLRYSPGCGTAWSEVRVRTPMAREVSVRAGQDVLSASYPANESAEDTSPMLAVRSPKGVEACAEVGGKLACTGLDVEPPGE
ncbi:XRE family transcriptional regulator [Streptomyces sp. Ag109_G2-15]|uniref:XRE family transcriptional regulator n=1 Tax=Streptomyces sp. Ag109_G2-15 TaxID=1938850 RepID=UPI000BD5DDA4|nr:XRE family transcriptional regulator [Streptomyces sp. Ag109_G2-15]SOD90788.1 Helix-turn-helix domain-containing protein [Streptomyces sp. Ag109_G2-15]